MDFKTGRVEIFRLLAMICRYIIYMRTENIYSVYVHKNLKNGKYYVGSTRQNPKRRWHGGWGYKNQPKMWSDIKESDWNTDWQHGVLGKFDNKQDALKYESFLIAMLGSAENGYNTSTYGNSHFKCSDKAKKKLSEANIGKHLSEETKKKIRENTPSKPVLQFSKNGEFIAEYSSMGKAERQTGCNYSHIGECCNGKRKTCGGYIWRYAS